MIIANLEHVETINTVNEVKGGSASTIFEVELLALGENSTESINTIELTSTSDSGTNISGAKGTLATFAS